MKAALLHENLNKGLSIVGRIIPNRGQLPVLANVLIEAKNDEIWLSATNLEIGLRIVLGGKVTEEGAVTIPAKSLGEFVGSMNEGTVNLEANSEKLTVSCGKLTATFTGISATEFPIMPNIRIEGSKSGRVKVKRKIIEEIAKEITFCAATDESRPVLTGVQFKEINENLMVTATDGFRLGRKTIKVDNEQMGIGGGLILPGRTILELARICGEGKKEDVLMEMIKENNQVVFEYGSVQLVSRILEGNFPEVDKIIPTEWETEIVADREQFLQAVKAVSIFARENNNIMKFTIGDNAMKVQATAQLSGESEVEVEIDKKGEDVSIAFNFRYVLDFLGSVTAERITIKLNDGLSPAVWGLDGNNDLTHVIMPVRI